MSAGVVLSAFVIGGVPNHTDTEHTPADEAVRAPEGHHSG